MPTVTGSGEAFGVTAKSAEGVKFRRMDTLSESKFVTARSALPSPLRSPIASQSGKVPTAKTVGAVRRAWRRSPQTYERIFRAIDELTLQGVTAIEKFDLERLGELMNVCHGLLNALQEPWVVFEPVVEPVVLRFEPD